MIIHLRKTGFFLVLMCILNLSANSQIKEFTLNGFLNQVENANIDLKISNNNMNLAKQAVNEAYSVMLPQVNGQTGFKHFFNDQFTFFELPDYENIDPETGNVPSKMQKFKVGFNNDFQAHILLEQNLLSFKNIYDLKTAKKYAELAELQSQDEKIKIMAEAKKMFYQAALLKIVFEVSTVSLDFAENNYRVSKSKFDNKLISELDLLQAQIRWEEEIPKLLNAKRNYLMVLENLKVVAGIKPSDSIAINYEFDEELNLKISNKGNETIANRIDFKILEHYKLIQTEKLKSIKSTYFPTLDLNGGYSYFSSSENWSISDNQNKYAYLGVKLNIPIVSGGYRNVQLKKAKINIDVADLRKENGQLKMAVEIKNLKLKLNEEFETIEAARLTKKTAQKAYQIAKKNAESGLTSQLDLRRISKDYKRAEINYYFSIYNFECTTVDYNIAIANY